MRVITAMELRKRLGEILDAASAGERFTIERDGRPMAVLVTPEAAARLDEDEQARIQRALTAIDRLDEFRDRMAREQPDPERGLTSVELIRRDRDGRAAHILGEIEAATQRVLEQEARATAAGDASSVDSSDRSPDEGAP